MSADQLDLFSISRPKFTIKTNIRLIELFAGIGAQASALKRLGIPFEHWRVVEIDPYPLASYNAIHGTDFKPTDICDLHGADLGIREREAYIPNDLFIPLSSIIACREERRYGEGQWNYFLVAMGSREDTERMRGTSSNTLDGKCDTGAFKEESASIPRVSEQTVKAWIYELLPRP